MKEYMPNRDRLADSANWLTKLEISRKFNTKNSIKPLKKLEIFYFSQLLGIVTWKSADFQVTIPGNWLKIPEIAIKKT